MNMSDSLTLQRTYRFRVEPTPEQAQALARFAGARRWIWNWALARKRAYYAEHGQGLSFAQLGAELTALKAEPETAWLKDIDSQLLQQALRDLEQAFKNFFAKRTRYPRFKSKKREEPSFRIPQRVVVRDGKVYVPKIGWVAIRQHRSIDGTTKSATFKQDATGYWYVTLVVAFTMPDVALPAPDPATAVGIDLGLKDFAVLSTGEKIPAPRFYRQGERKIRRAQRALARKQRGSQNRDKARRRLARVHRRVANQRHDFLHQLSTRLVREYDTICLEDLAVTGLAKTKLAKSVHDVGWGAFRRMLEYKTLWSCKRVVVIGRWYPSSKRCGCCGAIYRDLALAERTWTCATCQTTHDRDVNAAGNIRREGLLTFAQGLGEK
jgi:putative transposase